MNSGALRPIERKRPFRGGTAQLRLELGQWFCTRRWWLTILSVSATVALFMVLIAPDLREASRPRDEAVFTFNGILGITGCIAVVVLMQNALVGEKRSGVAAWILSQPISRTTFYLAKTAAHAVAIGFVVALAPTLVGYVALRAVNGVTLPAAGLLLAMTPHVVNLLFYATLVLMLGSIFRSRAPVIAIALAPLLLDDAVIGLAPMGVLDVMTMILPWGLATGYSETAPSIASSLMLGQRPYSLLPILSTLAFCALFTGVGAWSLRRRDL